MALIRLKKQYRSKQVGLDQYAYIASKANTEWDDDSRQDVAYWRKHPNLQGWMEQLAQEKGVQYDTFNGVELELTWEDIDRLEKDIKSGQVSELGTTGFFFGNPSDEYYREQDLEFCVNAKAELFLKRKVFYNSSW
jgi:hypothetical protein